MGGRQDPLALKKEKIGMLNANDAVRRDFSRHHGLSSLCFLLLSVFGATMPAAMIVDFEEFSLPPESAAPGDASQSPIQSHGAVFNRTWSVEYDCCPGGWAYSNQTDLTTPGFNNSYSAYVPPNGGGADGSANFAVANNLLRGESTVEFVEPVRVQGMYVTNTTYVYRAVVEGNDGAAGFVKGPFESGDWLRLEIYGLNATQQPTGSVPFYLADYRDGDSSVVSAWTWVDLSELGIVQRLEFNLDSTDQGMFGMNTPAYFAMDNLTFVVVPEPSTGLLVGIGTLLLAAIRRRAVDSRSRNPRRPVAG
jgi:hypothetical protein